MIVYITNLSPLRGDSARRAHIASPGGKLSSEARLKRNAGGNVLVLYRFQALSPVTFQQVFTGSIS